jgi:hypothetical protein
MVRSRQAIGPETFPCFHLLINLYKGRGHRGHKARRDCLEPWFHL